LKDQLGTDESLILLALQELIKMGNQEINVQDKLLMESGSLYGVLFFCGYFGIRLDLQDH
jgi:hypothetical protein